jgi:hypothetical protein
MKGKLRNKVVELSKLTKEDEIIKKLQEINEFFLRNFELRVKGYDVIEPIQVEAYYCNEQSFRDDSAHGENEQKNNFGNLYFHNVGRGGIDIVLSCGDYCLSLLLKTSKIGGEFFSQLQIADKIKKENYGDVLYAREKEKGDIVAKMVRKGLSKNSPYRDKWLGAVIGKEILRMPRLAFEECYGKEKTIEHYMDENPLTLKKEDIYEIFGYYPKILIPKIK